MEKSGAYMLCSLYESMCLDKRYLIMHTVLHVRESTLLTAMRLKSNEWMYIFYECLIQYRHKAEVKIYEFYLALRTADKSLTRYEYKLLYLLERIVCSNKLIQHFVRLLFSADILAANWIILHVQEEEHAMFRKHQ